MHAAQNSGWQKGFDMLVVSPQTARKQAPVPVAPARTLRPPKAQTTPGIAKKAAGGIPFGERKVADAKQPVSSKSFSAGRAISVTFLLGLAGVIYLAHVFATQRIIRDMQVLQKEYERARRLYEDRVLTYQRKTGPAEIQLKAKAAGFEFGGLHDETITVKAD